MIRMLSLIAVATMLFSCATATAQEEAEGTACPAQKCQNCQTAQFELVGVDVPLKTSTDDAKKAAAGKNEIAIKIECSTGIPFLNNLPIFGHTFHPVEGDFILIENAADPDQSAKAGSCCQCTQNLAPSESANEIVVQVVSDGEVPFLSNIPYVNRLFKNVGIEANHKQENTCQASDCPSACAKTTCPAASCEDLNCEVPECRANRLVKLVSHHEALSIKESESPSREELTHALMEMHVENAHLEAQLEAMEHHMEMMEEMFQVKAENAALQARLEMMEKQNARTTAVFHTRAATAHAHAPRTVIDSPHSPPQEVSHAIHASHAKHSLTPPAVGGSHSDRVNNARARIFARSIPATEIQRMTEDVRLLQKELTKQQCECSKTECGCKKATSK